MAGTPCLYGCSDPRTCKYRHDGCTHCEAVRKEGPQSVHTHVAAYSYFCSVCVTQVDKGSDHRCVGANW